MAIVDNAEEPVVSGNGHGYVMDIDEVPMTNGRGVSDTDIDVLLKSKKSGVKKLDGNGDFRSDECIEYLKQADIVVTNPPFSLFREYVALLMEYEKKFLIIGNQNNITYKEIFPLIQQNKIWLGCKFGDMAFRVPDYYEPRETRFWIDETGQKWRSFGTICWYTNLDHEKRHEELVLYRHYYGNEQDYPKYDNYDAINVNKVADIPCDYFENTMESVSEDTEITIKKDLTNKAEEYNALTDRQTDRQTDELHMLELSSGANCSGSMGVPITFLNKYNPEQFEIIGLDRYVPDNPRYGHRFTINGRETYARVLIKRRKL